MSYVSTMTILQGDELRLPLPITTTRTGQRALVRREGHALLKAVAITEGAFVFGMAVTATMFAGQWDWCVEVRATETGQEWRYDSRGFVIVCSTKANLASLDAQIESIDLALSRASSGKRVETPDQNEFEAFELAQLYRIRGMLRNERTARDAMQIGLPTRPRLTDL